MNELNELHQLPINILIQIFATHGLDIKELTEQQNAQMKIEQCNNYMHSLFRVIHYVADESRFGNNEMETEISHLAAIGMSFSRAISNDLEMIEPNMDSIDATKHKN